MLSLLELVIVTEICRDCLTILTVHSQHDVLANVTMFLVQEALPIQTTRFPSTPE